MDDSMATTRAVEAHVSALSGISVELMAEDLQIKPTRGIKVTL